MKAIVTITTVLLSVFSYGQNADDLRRIDSIVKVINYSDYSVQKDSIIKDFPELEMHMQTYLTMVIDGNQIKKYVNNVHSTTKENGVLKHMEATNVFYFDNNKLIKVEEFTGTSDKKIEFLWCYQDGKPLYYTLNTERAKDRAELLLQIAQAMLDKMKL